MSVLEKLDSVLAAIDALKIEAREGGDARAYLRMANSVERACYEHLRDHGPAIRQAMIDAERYRVVRAMCCSAEGPSAGLASAWMIGDEKAADAVIDARLASDSEGGE